MDIKGPVLYIDIEKSTSWREDLHKRLPNGRFTTIRAGSKVTTKTGKTGVVEKVTGTHYHYRDEATGKLAKVTKDNAIHHKDHTKVMEAQKKTKKRKDAAKKGQTTKAKNKANGTGKAKTVKAETTKVKKTATKKVTTKIAAPEKKQATKKATPKKVTGSGKNVAAVLDSVKKHSAKAKKEPKLTVKTDKDMSLNSKDALKTKEFKVPNGKKDVDPLEDKQTQALKTYDNMEKDTENTKSIDKMWQDPAVQKLMKRSPEKRSEADIRRLAGQITTENDNLARYVTLQMGKARGLNLLSQVNKIGDIGQSGNGEVISQETSHYGDLLQAARSSMYETLYRVMKGSQNPKEGTKIGAHIVSRMKQKLHSDIYNIMNEVPAPHEIRTAIGDMESAKKKLQQSLGREPEEKELADHLQANSKHFKEAPIMEHPTYDDKSGQWVATKKRIADPVERLRALNTYASQQKASSLDENIGKDGDKEVTAATNIKDTAATPDEAYEQKERQKELKSAIPKALANMGLTEHEKLVFMTMYGSPSAKIKRGNLTMPEVAEAVNSMGGLGGKQIDEKAVYNLVRSAMKKIQKAKDDNHPALQQLAMLKSLFYSMIMKALYEYDLVKSLSSFGVGTDVLVPKYTRVANGANLLSLKKSLAPYEYIGSIVTTEDGGIHARIVELVLPENNELYKSFNASRDSLKKSMFPHKGKSNHAVNKKAAEYVKANKAKYTTLSESQHSAAKAKSSNTWSEELLLKHPGSAWITWGGKRVLIDVGDGKILYDSANETHREEHNAGAQEDKIDFHHEKEELTRNEDQRGKDVAEAWKQHIAMKERNATKKKPVDYKKEQEDFKKKHRGAEFDEEGNLSFKGDEDLSDDNRGTIDHGIQAFKEQMEDMRAKWKGEIQQKLKDENQHRTNHAFNTLSEDQRKELEASEDKAQALGSLMQAQHGEAFQEAIKELHEKLKADPKDEAALKEFQEKMKTIGKGKSNAMVNADKMKALKNIVQKMPEVDSDEAKSKIAKYLGEAEISRGREEAGKKLLPEGAFMIGNPVTGQTMVVKIKHGFGSAGGKNNWTSMIEEAFDPEGGQHEDLNSWGGLGRALGIKGAKNIQEMLAQHSNTTEDKPFMKQLSDEEYASMRGNTKLGLQETMQHTNFKLVGENRDRKGGLISRTYAQDMPDGTQNTLHIDKDGYITDPVMARLLKQKKPIENINDLHEVMKNAVGNRAWVTAHFGSDIHTGDALGHHVQLEYDGKGAPRIVGGVYDGYRFMDKADIPKGAIDPATGEPIKALFKNGKLVDRKFTTKNEVPMKEGNAVMYKAENGRYRKGRIHSIEGTNYKITDGKGHVVGIFKKDSLKAATMEGKTLSDSGQAVVRLAENGVHRMNTEDVFKADNPRDQKKVDKVRELFQEALKKAGVNKAFDSEGNLDKNLELSDAAMARLKKKLGRSKAGRELLSKFKSAYTKELKIHVPEKLKEQVAAEGVNIGADGTAVISAGKFEHLRETLGGLSLDNQARGYLEDHFNRKDRKPKTVEELQKSYQPSAVDANSEFGKAYKAQFKPSSFLMNPSQGLYSAQLEGLAHLIERGRGIAGHSMGIGKTIEGVAAALHYKAQKLANGEKPKKTLIVSPAGIQSDWGKEIGNHTNSKALYIGSTQKLKKRDASGSWMKSENDRHMFGQDGTEQEAVGSKHFLKNMDKIGAEDHDFHIMSYDQFMKMRDELAKSGLYGNIIIDEVHAFKNQSGQRGKSLAETTDSFKNVWGLSGTPMENDATEVYSLIDTITGGRHELGTKQEFKDNYLMKDKNGKIIGVKPSKAEKLGDILANIVQFRNGSDVKFANGSSVHFPQIVGQTSEADPNPPTDFIGDLVDRSRDHQTTDYYGTKHSVFDYELGSHQVEGKDGGNYEVSTTAPTNLTPQQQEFYSRYNALQAKHLPEAKLKEMAKAAATGYDNNKGGKDSNKNYLTAMQKLQKYLNAPGAEKMYTPGGKNALDSDVTGAQGTAKKKSEGFKPYNPVTGEGHYVVDNQGHKRYFESDGRGGYLRNNDGSPKLLPPLHHNNPKAEYLKQRIGTYLDALANENARRRKDGRPELMPKVVVKSSYTTFGTDIVDGVLRDLQREHPHLAYWQNKLEKQGRSFGAGQFTGKAEDREYTKTGFRGDKKSYAQDQGNLWATTVSPAGKEGVDFGNAHLMLMYDQDWNPQRMAQFTARVRRSDSAKTHNQVGRANSVRIESLHMPGTVEDFMFNAEDAKMHDIKQVTEATRAAEQAPKFGDSEAKAGVSRNFTRSQKRKAGAKPTKPQKAPTPVIEFPKRPKHVRRVADEEIAAAKSLKLVILI